MTVRFEGTDELIRKLTLLQRLETVQAYMMAAAELLRGKFDKAPTQVHITRASVYGQPYASDAQRRLIGALYAQGEVPYHRGESGGSQRLEQSWTIEPKDQGLTVTIGNDTNYGPYVQGDDQSKFMAAAGWEKVTDITEREKDHLLEKIIEGLEREIEKGGE